MESLKFTSSRKRRSIITEINVTPMVDIMLVLLVVFMVASPMLVSGIDVNLPKTDSSSISSKEEPLTVTIDKSSNLYIMDTKIRKDELITKLKAITEEKTDTVIFVRGDKSINYGSIVEIVALINFAGFTKVSLITEIKTDVTETK